MTDQRATAFTALLAAHPRIAIVGGPRTGKTTLAKLVSDRVVLRSDGFSQHSWDVIPELICKHCGPLDRFVIEGGVHVARALRKGLKVDAVVYLDEPMAPRVKHQLSAAKSVATIFDEWRSFDALTPVHSLDIIQ